MKYFTPELFVAFNSEDVQVAAQASRAWERAATDYEKHLKTIRRRLPRSVRELSKLPLHDAEFIGFAEDVTVPDARSATMAIKRGASMTVFVYFLLEEPRLTAPIKNNVFSSQCVHWLYDELDLLGPTDFSHEILFSNGTVYRFRFRYLAILTISKGTSVADIEDERTGVHIGTRSRRAQHPQRKVATA